MILFLALFIAQAIAAPRDECPIEIFQKALQSTFGRTVEVVAPAVAKPATLATQHPELEKILDEIELYSGADGYRSQLSFYRDRFTAFCDAIAKNHPELGKSAFVGLDFELKRWERMFAEKPARAAGYELNGRLRSKIFELRTAISEPNVQGFGVKITKIREFEKRFDGALRRHEILAKTRKGYLEQLKIDFPEIMSNPRLQSKMDLFKALRRWIEDKEADLVLLENGKLKWVELKLNSRPMTLDEFKVSKYANKKSTLKQLEEDREIIRFLKMEGLVEVEFHAAGGMEPELEQELKVIGIKQR